MAQQQREDLKLKERENQQLREYLAELTAERERVAQLREFTEAECGRGPGAELGGAGSQVGQPDRTPAGRQGHGGARRVVRHGGGGDDDDGHGRHAY